LEHQLQIGTFFASHWHTSFKLESFSPQIGTPASNWKVFRLTLAHQFQIGKFIASNLHISFKLERFSPHIGTPVSNWKVFRLTLAHQFQIGKFFASNWNMVSNWNGFTLARNRRTTDGSA
jgi:hypothetical protein